MVFKHFSISANGNSNLGSPNAFSDSVDSAGYVCKLQVTWPIAPNLEMIYVWQVISSSLLPHSEFHFITWKKFRSWKIDKYTYLAILSNFNLENWSMLKGSGVCNKTFLICNKPTYSPTLKKLEICEIYQKKFVKILAFISLSYTHCQ